MKKVSNLLVVAILAAAVFVVPGVSAHDGEDHAEGETHTAQAETPAENAEPAEGQSAEEAVTYTYVAQEGDSYTVLARKAIQTYGIIHSVNLSGAEIIAAETKLTQQAGSPVLVTGQEVAIEETDVKQVVESAQALTDAEEALWEVYVPFVDFNTDAAGQAQA